MYTYASNVDQGEEETKRANKRVVGGISAVSRSRTCSVEGGRHPAYTRIDRRRQQTERDGHAGEPS